MWVSVITMMMWSFGNYNTDPSLGDNNADVES